LGAVSGKILQICNKILRCGFDHLPLFVQQIMSMVAQRNNRGVNKRGCPIIGDNVYIGSGAKIFGAIRIGDNSAIGANCVVTK
jgi:acetyltransferase-like isoleucine patch superfamily enzyme